MIRELGTNRHEASSSQNLMSPGQSQNRLLRRLQHLLHYHPGSCRSDEANVDQIEELDLFKVMPSNILKSLAIGSGAAGFARITVVEL